MALILVFLVFRTQNQLNTTRRLVLQHQEMIEQCQKDINLVEEDVQTLQYKKYVTPEELEKVRMSGYDYSWEIYEEMRDFIQKAESRLPILKRI